MYPTSLVESFGCLALPWDTLIYIGKCFAMSKYGWWAQLSRLSSPSPFQASIQPILFGISWNLLHSYVRLRGHTVIGRPQCTSVWIQGQAKLQVGLVEPPMLVVMVLRKDLTNMAPFYKLTVVSKGPWLRYMVPPVECQLLKVLEHI